MTQSETFSSSWPAGFAAIDLASTTLKAHCERMELNLAGFLELGYIYVHPQPADQEIASRLISLLPEKAGAPPYCALAQERKGGQGAFPLPE